MPSGEEKVSSAPRPSGVALGRVAGAWLVPRGDGAHGRAARHRVVERQDRPTGQAEHHLDALRLERAEDRVCPGHLHAALPHGIDTWNPAMTLEVNSRV